MKEDIGIRRYFEEKRTDSITEDDEGDLESEKGDITSLKNHFVFETCEVRNI